MKVKIITKTYGKDLEDEINEFIKDKVVHDIKYTAIVSCKCTAQHRVLIMYDEIPEVPVLVPQAPIALL